MWLKSMVDEVVYIPRAERISVDLEVPARLSGSRVRVLLKDLTCEGARIDSMAGLRYDDVITPAWADGRSWPPRTGVAWPGRCIWRPEVLNGGASAQVAHPHCKPPAHGISTRFGEAREEPGKAIGAGQNRHQ